MGNKISTLLYMIFKRDWIKLDNDNCKLLTNYLNYCSNLNKSKGTIKEYKYDLTNFLKYMKFLKTGDNSPIADIGADFLSKIDLNDLYSYMAYLKDECANSAITRARKVASIKGFFKYLYSKAKLIDNNPAMDLETPKIGKRLPKYLTLEQSTALLEEVKNKKITGKTHDNTARDYAMIVLLLNCGVRLSELVGIDIDHIKSEDASLTVIGKGNKERTIYLNKACVNAINDYCETRPRTKRWKGFVSKWKKT